MTENGNGTRCQSERSNLRKISVSEDWFEVYEIASNLFAFCETRHYENTTVSLIIGREKAALIDTGCGIGNLRKAVAEVTDKPVIVINTHTHLDHLGSNRQFDEIAMFDHPLSRRLALEGASHQIMQREILAENLVTEPWPQDFDPRGFALPPFNVNHWLRDGDRLDFGGRDLEVIYTPGEAADHICLLDKADRILFCGDILLYGPVWTHLEGGSLKDLLTSSRRLMGYFEEFDHLMPGHNQPWIDKGLLPETLAGAEKVLSGQAEPEDIIDPWNRQLKQYSFSIRHHNSSVTPPQGQCGIKSQAFGTSSPLSSETGFEEITPFASDLLSTDVLELDFWTGNNFRLSRDSIAKEFAMPRTSQRDKSGT